MRPGQHVLCSWGLERWGGGAEEARTVRWGEVQAGRLSAGSVKTSLGQRGLEPKPFCRRSLARTWRRVHGGHAVTPVGLKDAAMVDYHSTMERREILPFGKARMDLKGIMLSEINTDKYCMILFICGILK